MSASPRSVDGRVRFSFFKLSYAFPIPIPVLPCMLAPMFFVFCVFVFFGNRGLHFTGSNCYRWLGRTCVSVGSFELVNRHGSFSEISIFNLVFLFSCQNMLSNPHIAQLFGTRRVSRSISVRICNAIPVPG